MQERRSDATSKETLEDLEKGKKISDSGNDDGDQAVPSPDGQPADNDRVSIEGADV